MWNLVQMDEETLLVDLTNCDDGSIGWPDGLFLVSGSASNGGWTYTVPLSGRSAVYTYDSATVTAYGLGTLALHAIVPRDSGSAVIHLGQQSVYNGQPQQVVIDAVELDGTVLTPGTDYEIVSGGSGLRRPPRGGGKRRPVGPGEAVHLQGSHLPAHLLRGVARHGLRRPLAADQRV